MGETTDRRDRGPHWFQKLVMCAAHIGHEPDNWNRQRRGIADFERDAVVNDGPITAIQISEPREPPIGQTPKSARQRPDMSALVKKGLCSRVCAALRQVDIVVAREELCEVEVEGCLARVNSERT